MCKKVGCQSKIKKDTYGGYCYKHRNEYITYDGIILFDKFTGKQSDYLKNDILKTLDVLVKDNGWKNIKKEYTYNILNEYYSDNPITIPSSVLFTRSFLTVKNINFLKGLQRKYSDIKINFLKGEGFKNKMKCNNDTDFFTYDSISDIDQKYFFSYKDKGNFIWFFDIRSFNKLIEIGQTNPYTREEIPQEVKDRAKILSQLLKLTNEEDIINSENIRLSRRQTLKQRVIDIFSEMEQFGYSCNIEWFLELNSRKLKGLYRNLEDIWNYRLNLPYETKARISPPNGIAFNVPVVEVNALTSTIQLQEIIINEVSKFKNAITEDDKKLGYMYFLLGLGLISRRCYEVHHWIMHAVY